MRTLVTLACTECKRRNYTTNKNKQNNPERIVWGTDWPFLSHLDAVTYPQLVALFESWVPDRGDQRRILVDNPARLLAIRV